MLSLLSSSSTQLRSNDKVERVKQKLKTQLKSIIKTHPTPARRRSMSTSVCTMNKDYEHDLYRFTNRQSELLKQVQNHSFKDLSLIEIKPNLMSSLEAVEAEIPVVDNTYQVKILKKPYSMKWLNNRRLSLFLQSDIYNEFKLAMLLSQYELYTSPCTDEQRMYSFINDFDKIFKFEIIYD